MIAPMDDFGGKSKPYIKIIGVLGEPILMLNLYAVKFSGDYELVVATNEFQAERIWKKQSKKTFLGVELMGRVLTTGPHVVKSHSEAYAFGTQVAQQKGKQ